MSIWYEKAIFYHMYPLGMTGAPRDNNSPNVEHRFDQLDQWVPHIRDLGCSAVYIGPLFESQSHGYDTRDYRLVDRRLGDNKDFKNFVSLCHEAGIRVVVDGVFNHTGREFFAFRDIAANRENSVYCDWYRGIHFGGSSPMGDAFGYEAWQGHGELPCLNLKNPKVKEYLFDVIQDWITEFDIDGIRLDCANVMDFDFMREMRQQTGRMKSDFWLMGEVIHGDYSRWVSDQMLHSVTNYELHKSLYSGHNDHNYFEIAHNVKRLEAIGRQLYTFVDNHDEDRIASKLTNREHLFPIYLLLMTLPGIPSVYYGSEWGLEGKRSKTSDYALRPAITAGEAAENSGELTRQLGLWAFIHNRMSALHSGRYQELYLSNRQYAFARLAPDSAVLTAVNNDEAPATIQIPIPTDISAAGSLTDNSLYPVENGKITVTLPGNRGVILNITKEQME